MKLEEAKKKVNYVAEGFKFETKEDHTAIDPITGKDLNDNPPF